MGIINILHLSDLHFGAEGKKETALAHRANALNGFLKIIADQSWKPQILVISGDIAYKGKKEDYVQAETWLNEICRSLDIPPECIVIVPGNHDLDRDETIGMEPPPNVKKADFWLSKENLRHFEKYFADYKGFFQSLKIPEYKLGSSSSILTGTRKIMDIQFVALNSAWFCRGDDDKENLWLGLELMKVMQANGELSEEISITGPITIAVFHHPEHYLNEKEIYNHTDRIPAINFIGRRSHIILSGHVHSKSVVPIKKTSNAVVWVGGATYADDNYYNIFSIIQVDQDRKSARRRNFIYNPGNETWSIDSMEIEETLCKKTESLTSQFQEKVRSTAEQLDLKDPPYNYKISFAESYLLLKQGACSNNQEIECLIPSETHPGIVLHGGGGIGKTEILRRLFRESRNKGKLPILLNLKRYANNIELLSGDPKNIETILAFTTPRISISELEQLIKETPVLILIDAFSEVSNEIRSIIVDYFNKLIFQGQCLVLIADRLVPTWDYADFTHAKVNYLDSQTIQKEFDKHELGSYDALDQNLQSIYRNPFFLDLATRTRNVYEDSRVRTAIFKSFFETHLKSTNADEIAQTTFEAIKDGIVVYTYLEKHLKLEIIQKLEAAGVLQGQAFEHHLWVDYLVSRYLSQNPSQWKDQAFDAATIYSSAAFESLMMTIEQLNSVEETDKFLKTIFDWNLTAAVYCIGEHLSGVTKFGHKLSSGIRTAIIATTIEKTFDGIYRTRKRANATFESYKHLDEWKPYLTFDLRVKLADHVKAIHSDSEWFTKWKEIFVDNGDGCKEKVDLIKCEDPLIGWAAANLARRASLSDLQQGEIRTIFLQHTKDEEGSIRWRAVHCLGEYGSKENIDLLFYALTNDKYHWVQYGATRALIEIASKSEGDLRSEVLKKLPELLRTLTFKSEHIRRQIIQEAIECTFMRTPAPRWKEEALDFLLCVTNLETEYNEKKKLNQRVQEFMDYDENA